MIERLEGKVENISVLQHLSQNLDLCEIQIDFDKLKIFYDSNDLLEFIGQDVSYTTRPDVVNGEKCLVICELVSLSTIQTVKSRDNIKLIPEGNKRTICNIESDKIRFGDFYPGVTALMSGWKLGTSSKARWYDCDLIDKNSRSFVVRLFASNANPETIENNLNACIAHYVHFDMESTKYGYQTKEILPMPNAVEESPEVVVARTLIQDMINEDSALKTYCQMTGFINQMSKVIDGEPGYGFVRMASELYMINAVDNISTELDIRAMKRAIICSRSYLLPHNTDWSRPMLNITKVLSIPELKNDHELMLILDVLSNEKPSETKLTYIKIRGLVNDIIDIRRGTLNENEKDSFNFSSVISSLNGLL